MNRCRPLTLKRTATLRSPHEEPTATSVRMTTISRKLLHQRRDVMTAPTIMLKVTATPVGPAVRKVPRAMPVGLMSQKSVPVDPVARVEGEARVVRAGSKMMVPDNGDGLSRAWKTTLLTIRRTFRFCILLSVRT